uniref:DUF229 domain-containing protein n=1 Tax=Glossina austeni TaxID=7395 RepID=A0A1A9V8U4_GLOAU
MDTKRSRGYKYERLAIIDSNEPNPNETNICKNCYNSVINITSTKYAQWMLNIIFCSFLFTLLTYRSFKNSIGFHNNLSEMQINMTLKDTALPGVDSNENDELKYFLNTSQCFIQYIDPLMPEIRKLYKPQFTTGCSKHKYKPLVNVVFDNNAKQYILRMNMTAVQQIYTVNNLTMQRDPMQCCYQEIVRLGNGSNPDSEISLLACTYFRQDYMVPSHIDSLLVVCKLKLDHKTITQRNAFFLVQVKNRRRYDFNATAQIKPSLILWGIDSVSRINFRRTMPKTFNYLKQRKWFELRGYNKIGDNTFPIILQIGDNTFPNLMALLTGQNQTAAMKTCKPKEIGGLDKCRFIWKEFHEQGYHTAYGEDTPSMSTFNYLKKGFREAPTDYYFRPMSLAIEENLTSKNKAGLKYCVGNRQYGEYVYDMGLQFVTRFQYEPNFGLFWTNSFSHNDYSVPATMDSTILKYLKEMEALGIFDSTIVFFLSDHGMRFGQLVRLPGGFLEERLPTFFISIPKWFHNTYPELIKNLHTNCQRLTTPYDIYMTMQHLLKINEPNFDVKAATGCTRCQSLFRELPENRTCSDAEISENWCTCTQYKILSSNRKEIKHLSSLIVKRINDYIINKNLSSVCSELTLHNIKEAKQHYNDEDLTLSTYRIEFSVNPKTKPEAIFAATVKCDPSSHEIALNLNVEEDVNRQMNK